MKKTIIALSLTLLTLSSNLVHSEEAESEKMAATEDYVLSLLTYCKEYAKDDEVTKSDMTAYLLSCINDELDSGYYLPIKVLPKENIEESEPN
jgi:hypothetical protein